MRITSWHAPTFAAPLRILARSFGARSPAGLKRRFVEAGRLLDLHRSDVIRAIGRPDHVSSAPFGGVLFRWTRSNAKHRYEIVLMFDAEGRCLGVTHEDEWLEEKTPTQPR